MKQKVTIQNPQRIPKKEKKNSVEKWAQEQVFHGRGNTHG